MSKYSELFTWLRGCPKLADMWSIGAREEIDVNVILPQGASQAVAYQDYIDVYGAYHCEMIPEPSVYEDYQLNCFRYLDVQDRSAPAYNVNVMQIEDVQDIIDWITEQNDNDNQPEITGEHVVSVECNPRVPQIRYVNQVDNTVAYFITIRVRYVNRAKRKAVSYVLDD